MLRSVVRGCGRYEPMRVMTNGDISKNIDTNDEWIVERTGIKERRIAADDETTSILGYKAALDALKNANMDAEEIDLIVLATTTADNVFPSSATIIQNLLGITKGAAFDIQAVCTGFVYALNTADNFLKSGQFKNALVIGAEVFSRIIDWNDRGTCILFGDGAGAMVLSAVEDENNADKRGVIASKIRSDGRYKEHLFVDGGPSSSNRTGFVKMNGSTVFRHAATKMSEVVRDVLAESKYDIKDINWMVPHQANIRILNKTAELLEFEKEKVIITVDKHGNTSAASVPMALCEAVSDKKIKKNDLVLLVAMGGGFTWGANIIKW